MRDLLAMVLAGGRVNELGALTLKRPKSALPFGGMYRIIDFPLSNLMHSGVERVGILSQYRPASLMRHIDNGQAWEFCGRNRFVSILPPFTGNKVFDWYQGTADAVYQNQDFIRENPSTRTMILSGDHVYNMNYRELLAFHDAQQADVTIAFKQVPAVQAGRFGLGVFSSDADDTGGRITNYFEKPGEALSNWASLTIYIFRTPVLLEILNGGSQLIDIGRDILPDLISRYRVFGYKFYGFWGYTRTLEEYYKCNMNLLGNEPNIDPDEWQVRTNLAHRGLQDRAPAIFRGPAKVSNSLVYNGCRVEGEIQNSILFPGVVVKAGAKIKNSIITFDCEIQEGAVIDHAILDSDVVVESKAAIGVSRKRSQALGERLTVVGRSARVPAGCELFPGKQILPESCDLESIPSPTTVQRKEAAWNAQ